LTSNWLIVRSGKVRAQQAHLVVSTQIPNLLLDVCEYAHHAGKSSAGRFERVKVEFE
jgi:hypothetical protein